jgi:hypothetical protein
LPFLYRKQARKQELFASTPRYPIIAHYCDLTSKGLIRPFINRRFLVKNLSYLNACSVIQCIIFFKKYSLIKNLSYIYIYIWYKTFKKPILYFHKKTFKIKFKHPNKDYGARPLQSTHHSLISSSFTFSINAHRDPPLWPWKVHLALILNSPSRTSYHLNSLPPQLLHHHLSQTNHKNTT